MSSPFSFRQRRLPPSPANDDGRGIGSLGSWSVRLPPSFQRFRDSEFDQRSRWFVQHPAPRHSPSTIFKASPLSCPCFLAYLRSSLQLPSLFVKGSSLNFTRFNALLIHTVCTGESIIRSLFEHKQPDSRPSELLPSGYERPIESTYRFSESGLTLDSG